MKLFRFAPFLLAMMLAASCGQERSAEHSENSALHAHGEETDIVGLTAGQVQSISLTTRTIEKKNFTNTLKVSGKLEVPPQNKASVTSLYSGIIRSIDVHPGSTVRKGQLIATITNAGLSDIQQQYLSVDAQYGLAGLEVKRQEELVRGNAAPMKNLQKAQAELSSLRAQRSALARQLADLGISAAALSSGNISSTIRITAPISGTISDIHTQIGSNVDATTPMAEIVNNSQLHLDLFVFEKDLAAPQCLFLLRVLPEAGPLARIALPLDDSNDIGMHPGLKLQQNAVALAAADQTIARRSMLPDFSGRFFSQRLYGLPNPYSGFSVAVAVPVLGIRSYRTQIRAATLEREYQERVLEQETLNLRAAQSQARTVLRRDAAQLQYYENTGLRHAEAILAAATLSYRAGQISFAELSGFITQALDIRNAYLDALNQYNQSSINILFYSSR